MLELFPEQVHGAAWLAGRENALLADTMGLGKSAQAIEAARLAGAQRVTIACPAVARLNWERECHKWGLDLPVVRVTDKADHALPHPHAEQVVIASYDGIAGSKRLRGHLNAGLWDALILDEGQYLKTADARRTRAVYGANIDANRCLAGKAAQRWMLTASPFPNHIGEMWTHFHALWPNLIRNQSGQALGYDEFLARYCITQTNQYGGTRVLGYRDRDGLVALLNEIMLRRDEIKGLPDLILRDEPTLVEVDSARLRELEAHEEFRDLEAVLNSVTARREDLGAIEDDFIHLPTLRRLTGILKAKPVAELTRAELSPSDKIVLFAIHREVIDILRAELADFSPAVVHGGVPDGERNREIDRFNEDARCGVFLGQIEATKTAINLPAANRVRLVEQSWCVEDNLQAIKRVHRRGQMRQVFADAVAIAGSIDEAVQRVLTLNARNIHELMKERYDGK